MLLVGLLLLLVAALVGAGWFVLRASLPTLDGAMACQGLSAPIQIERDQMGVVTVRGENRFDVAYALGFAHAQDRRFQMDLYRRLSAGELSALLGRGALASDLKMRVHGFRKIAQEALAMMPEDERTILERYAHGVNAATKRFRIRPFEYLLLRAQPEAWCAEDSILVNHTMFALLQHPEAINKVQRGLIANVVPKEVTDFVYGEAPDWSAAIDGTLPEPIALPKPHHYDLRRLTGLDFEPPQAMARVPMMQGSNAWVVGKERSAKGALVANDMHLGLSIPNIWYRACLRVGPDIDVSGVTLPGTPFVLAGSNGHVAWGLTNSFIDSQEVIVCESDPSDAQRYLTSQGASLFMHRSESIAVKGKKAVALDVLSTEWGPVIGKDAKGRFLSLQWTAHLPEAAQMGIWRLESTKTVSEALQVAKSAGTPAVNFLVGDAAGHVGWTLMGKIPKWKSDTHQLPRMSTDANAGFDGLLTSREHPSIEDSNGGVMVSANNRAVGGGALKILGDGGYELGTRAFQIKQALDSQGGVLSEKDMLALQLDDRALLLSAWHKRLMMLLDDNAVSHHPKRHEMREVLRTFSHKAAVDDAAYPLIRAFRQEMMRRVFFALIGEVRAQNPQFAFMPPASFEGPLMMMLEQEPLHLLAPPFESWRALQLSVIDSLLSPYDVHELKARTWGKVNRVRIRHVLSRALPGFGWLLDMPFEPMPGDEHLPRVNCPEVGASERFALCVGDEANAYFMMPGGQSGHPLSPFYRAGHAAWVRGEFSPFLPQEAKHRLSLSPQ